jgi:biopolymer transport protein ExbD
MVRSRRRRAISYIPPQSSFAPIATINTTPLIDMMLVILIMVIVAIPVSNHRVPLDLPPPDPMAAPPPPSHALAIAANGALAWDGRPLAPSELGARLRALRADPLRPVLQLDAAGEARYERVDEVLGEIARAGVTRLGFVGNRRFAEALDRP